MMVRLKMMDDFIRPPKRVKQETKQKTNQRESFNCYFDYCLSCNWVFLQAMFQKRMLLLKYK